jgi:hypothetical protein
MDADFSIELGRDDPALDFPWSDASGKLCYYDLKRHPELLAQVEEAARFPELAGFLHTVNSSLSLLESAKCDVWATRELGPEEEIYGASHKFASYVDLVLSDIDQRLSFPFHELFAKQLVELLRRTPETPSAAEVCVRRCHLRTNGDNQEGFCCALYVTGYGADEPQARQNWGIALRLAGNAVLQLSAAGVG